MNYQEALALVPEGARNRETLAHLLSTVEAARRDIAEDAKQADWHCRLRHIAGLLAVRELAAKGTEYSRAHTAVHRAVNAARVHATRNGLHPNTFKTVLAEARLILEAAR